MSSKTALTVHAISNATENVFEYARARIRIELIERCFPAECSVWRQGALWNAEFPRQNTVTDPEPLGQSRD